MSKSIVMKSGFWHQKPLKHFHLYFHEVLLDFQNKYTNRNVLNFFKHFQFFWIFFVCFPEIQIVYFFDQNSCYLHQKMKFVCKFESFWNIIKIYDKSVEMLFLKLHLRNIKNIFFSCLSVSQKFKFWNVSSQIYDFYMKKWILFSKSIFFKRSYESGSNIRKHSFDFIFSKFHHFTVCLFPINLKF